MGEASGERLDPSIPKKRHRGTRYYHGAEVKQAREAE